MCLNHPENIPSSQLSMEKLSSTKSAPGAKKVGDGWYKVCSSKKLTLHVMKALALTARFQEIKGVEGQITLRGSKHANLS